MIKTLTKRISVLTFIASMCFTGAFSQYTLQSSNLPAPYVKWEFQILSDTSIQPLSGGAGVIWDFNLYTVSVNTLSEVYEVPSASGVDATFPTANLKKLNYFGWTDYYYRNPAGTELQFLGIYNSSNEIHVSNTQKLLTIPLTYGNSISNAALAGSGYGGSTLAGTISVIADGYGTLKVGGITFNNVTRVKTDMTIVEDFGSGLTGNVHVVKYSWYKTGTNAPYFEIVTLNMDGILGTSTQKYAIKNYRVNIGVDELAEPNLGLSVFPNPLKDQVSLKINLNRTSDVTLQIMDITGKVKLSQTTKQTAGEHEMKLDVSDLSKGVYILSAISGTINRQQRIVITE